MIENTLRPIYTSLSTDKKVVKGELQCMALGTGMKCLPESKVPLANGNVLHDWHAEVVALRSLNRFLLEECLKLATDNSQDEDRAESKYITWVSENTTDSDLPPKPNLPNLLGEPPLIPPCERSESGRRIHQRFKIRDEVKLHMYCSEAPCGDASMELTMAAQDDATPWALPPPPAPLATVERKDDEEGQDSRIESPGHRQKRERDGYQISPSKTAAAPSPSLPGRANFSLLGIVRRKPSRPDAPATLSKSCSDKLATKQLTSVLNSLTSLLIHPSNAYLSTFTIPKSQYVPEAWERCFGRTGRLQRLGQRLDNVYEGDYMRAAGYWFKPFGVLTTEREFAYSRRTKSSSAEKEEMNPKPSNIACSWSPYHEETIIGGVLQGAPSKFPVPDKAASAVSRRRLWKVQRAVMVALVGEGWNEMRVQPYGGGGPRGFIVEGKSEENWLCTVRYKVKSFARRVMMKEEEWVENKRDSEWCLEERD